jgi:hypothetical protein
LASGWHLWHHTFDMKLSLKPKRNLTRYFAHNFFNVLAIVLIWRGIWYVLDCIDGIIFRGEHIVTVIGGIVIGFAILYLPDKDLNELEKL